MGQWEGREKIVLGRGVKEDEAVREGKTQREETRMRTADWMRVEVRMGGRD